MAEVESGTYRRGLTLGLTMAEIFLLILFLLLLVLLALHTEYEQNKVTLEGELAEITAKYDERTSLPVEIQRLKRENTELERIVAVMVKKNSIAKSLLEESKRKRLPKDIREFIEQIESLENDLATAREENSVSAVQSEKIQKQNIELRNQLYASKGVDPPCWYEAVFEKGKRREKTYYLLDVAVHDEYLRIRVNQNIPLPGRAIDEYGQHAPTSYAEEYAKLPLTHLAAVKEKQVSLDGFRAIAEPVKNIGKSGQIRDYACVFYARIWDHTSTTAKERWQRGRETVEDFFYPLLMRNDPWVR